MRVWSRLRFVVSRRRFDEEASRELAAHQELLTERFVRSGMTREDARFAAMRQIGNVTLVREDIHHMNSVQWLDTLTQDVLHAGRVFARNRVFAAVVILTLALGIGANVAIFSVVHATLLKPLPYASPDELHSAEVVIKRRDPVPSVPVTIQIFREWRSASTVFSGITALRPWEANLVGDGEPQRVGGARVGTNFFDVLGVPMAAGRSFRTDEEQPGRDRVVVISDGLWRSRYAASPDVVGRTIAINDDPHLVVGIAPPSLVVPTGTRLQSLVPFASNVDIWRPIAPTPAELKQESWDHGVVVRLPAGASPVTGAQQLTTLLNQRIRQTMPDANIVATAQLVPIREAFAGKIRLRLLLILAASCLLLLTACASIANLFLARVATRANEFATRVALGASRGRILSQTLTEAMLLAAGGGAAAALLAVYGARVFATFGPEDLRLMGQAAPSLTLLAFGLIVTMLTGLAAGVVPAWQSYRRESIQDLRSGAVAALGGAKAARTRRILVGVETALATMLLGASGLLLHSFVNVMATDRGYEVERILAVDLSLFGRGYASADARSTFYAGLLDKVRGLPAVVSAGAISNLPALAAWGGASRTILYDTDTSLQSVVLERPVAMIRSTTDGYFVASGTALKAGRYLLDDEPVLSAVISEGLAARLWPDQPLSSVVGRTIRSGSHLSPLTTIVGVVADALPGGLDRGAPAVVYLPHRQWSSGPMTLVVRTASDPAIAASAIRAEIRAIDGNLPILEMRTMREIVSSTVAERRFQMLLTTTFAVVALLLGLVGVYGVVSYNVARRTRDIGLRIALGAERGEVMRWVFSTGMKPVLIGVVVGLAATMVTANSLQSLLYGIAPTDAVSLGSVALTLLVASGLACYVPARRAASLDPITALRHE